MLPSLLHTSYCGDAIEVQNIAPEWVWATKKHPMLPAWVLEILNILTCRSFAVPFIATQLCTLLTLWSVWQLGRTVLNERLALVGAFSVLPCLFFACKPVWFNQNNVLIAFWALSMYLTFQALQTNQKRYWISAGIALGLAFHAKYPTVLLVISILAYMFMREKERKYFWTPGPYITTLIAFVIFLPHIIWLIYHDFPTIAYAVNKIPMPRWLAPFYFAGGQLLYLALPLVVFTPVLGFIWKWKVQHHEQGKTRECEKFLFYCFIIPLIVHILYGGIMGIKVLLEYGATFWSFFGLWLLLRFQHKQDTLQIFRQTTILTVTIMLLIASGFAALSYFGQQHPKHYLPMRELGVTCEQLWHSQFPTVNCPYIAGDNLGLVGHTAHAMTVRPSVIMPQGTWADDDDLNRKGGMIVWEEGTPQTVTVSPLFVWHALPQHHSLQYNDGDGLPAHLRRRFPEAQVLAEKPELPYKVGPKTYTLKLGIAIVPPMRE
jgi:4-amino-4-deoxy-L-arabinose transferase-like glycosyltransferase